MADARTRFKICCIQDEEEVRLAVRYGASAVGLVAHMPSGPGVISEARIAAIARTVPPGVATFLLTSLQAVDAIIAQQRRCRTDTIQLCDALTDGTWADLRAALPGIRLVQVIHVTGPEALAAAEAAAPQVDALLLDSGKPQARVKQLGGTGQVHDWSVSRQIRDRVDCPIFLAGGLNSGNIAEAIAMVNPYAVDVCSGLRTADRLDEAKLAAFTSRGRLN
jgi:phosphoribosylanthranilate isomerase